jgi:tubulin polyglutamylase TTLL6/13
MRIYALIAGCDPLRIYIFNEGLVRFATEIYQEVDPTNIDNLYMHLTNYAINKDNPKYVFNESLENLSFGHKKSVAEFFQTLKGLGLPANEYWTSIKDIIVKTMIAGQPHLQHEYRMAQPHNV